MAATEPLKGTVEQSIAEAPKPAETVAEKKTGKTKQDSCSVATRIAKLAENFPLFHDQQKRGFARITVKHSSDKSHTEQWLLKSTSFQRLLAYLYFKATKQAANRNALADATAILEGRAIFDSPEEPVFLRVAPHQGHIIIDLCDHLWRVVEVTPDGWRILDKSPVAFIRTPSMLSMPIPTPAADGSLNPLWELLNVTIEQRPLVAGALLSGLNPHGPFFVTNYVGEQGSAKSTAAKIHRQLVDPSEMPLRSPPREDRDLLVQAGSNWCVVLDNLSSLPQWLSDSLCRLATGGGHSARQLYSDGDEFTLSVKRPVILTGIEDVANRPDLAERTLQIELSTIPDERRLTEGDLWTRFEAARPVILSGLLNGLVCALREKPNLTGLKLPRMADAALFATAGEGAFGWERGTFLKAHSKNLDESAIESVESHPVGAMMLTFLDTQPEWNGEPAMLLKELTNLLSNLDRRPRNWPSTPRALSVCLRRLAQSLRKVGVQVESSRGKRRHIRLCKAPEFATAPTPPTPGVANDASVAKILPLRFDGFPESVWLQEDSV